MRTQDSYTRCVAQRTNLRKSSRHEGLCRMVEYCQNPSIYVFWYYNVRVTERKQKGYRGGTVGVQMGYRGDTDGIQMGYRKGTEGIHMGTERVQRGPTKKLLSSQAFAW